MIHHPDRSFAVVCFGEVLWDLLPSASLPGGAPMNVAYHLGKLGVKSALITRVGQDDWGEKLKRHLEESGLDTSFTQVDPGQNTGLVEALPSESGDVRYVIREPAAWDFIAWEPHLDALVSQSAYFVFGSLACREPLSRSTLFRLLESAAFKVLDINLRPPFYTSALVKELLSKADFLKLNEEELEWISRELGGPASIPEGLKFLQDRFGLSSLVCTRGSRGAVFCQEGLVYEHPGYRVRVADTIGSGDAFLAALLSGRIKGWEPAQILSFASALGAFVASRQGPCPRYLPEEITALMEK